MRPGHISVGGMLLLALVLGPISAAISIAQEPAPGGKEELRQTLLLALEQACPHWGADYNARYAEAAADAATEGGAKPLAGPLVEPMVESFTELVGGWKGYKPEGAAEEVMLQDIRWRVTTYVQRGLLPPAVSATIVAQIDELADPLSAACSRISPDAPPEKVEEIADGFRSGLRKWALNVLEPDLKVPLIDAEMEPLRSDIQAYIKGEKTWPKREGFDLPPGGALPGMEYMELRRFVGTMASRVRALHRVAPSDALVAATQRLAEEQEARMEELAQGEEARMEELRTQLAVTLSAQMDAPTRPLAGHVYLPDGITPAAGARVFAELLNTDRWHNAPPITVPHAVQTGGVRWAPRIGEDGAFSLPCPVNNRAGEPALYFVQVDLKGYPPLRSEPLALGEEEVDLMLSTGQPLRGVVSGPEGRPRAGVRVTAYWINYRGGGYYAGETEPRYGQVAKAEAIANGTYELGPLAPGRYDVWATADDLTPVGRLDVEVTPRAPGQLDLVSPLPAEISGKVVYIGTDDPVEGVELWIYLDEAREHRRAWSAPDGSFRLSFLPGGTIALHARKEGLTPRIIDLDTVAGEVREETVEMCEGGTIDVLVVTEEEEPVPDAEISLRLTSWTQGGGEKKRLRVVGRTDPEGHLRVDRLWPTEYSVLAHHRELGSGETEDVPVTDRQTSEAVVVIGK